MNYILLPFRVIYKIYYLIFFVLSMVCMFPILKYLLRNPRRFPTAFKLMRVHAFLCLVFAGVKLKVKGEENIPKEGSYIICPNHSSYLDIFCLYTIFIKYFVFTGKQEIEKWPLFHIYYTSGMNILVDRASKMGTVKAIKRMSQEIEKGNPLVIFPEGTISRKAPQLAPFKSGAFAIAVQRQVPIVPISFLTNWKLLQRGSFWFGKAGPGVAEVIVHKPVPTSGLGKDDVDSLQHRVNAIINGPLLAL